MTCSSMLPCLDADGRSGLRARGLDFGMAPFNWDVPALVSCLRIVAGVPSLPMNLVQHPHRKPRQQLW